MLEKVIAIVAEGLGVEAGNLNAETTFESLGADSLDLMDMVMNFEDEFGIEIDADSMGTLKTCLLYTSRRCLQNSRGCDGGQRLYAGIAYRSTSLYSAY